MNRILYYSIATIAFLLLSLSAVPDQKITVHTIGDSTMAPKDTIGNPERGWAMALPFYLDSTKVKVENYARNGRSTKSFIDEGRWQTVLENMKPGDYLFIQFGHNDEKINKPAVYADPHGAYTDNLTLFVEGARSKGAFPVLMTSIVQIGRASCRERV